MPDADIKVVHHDDAAYTSIVLDRPAKRNALSPLMLSQILQALQTAADDNGRLVVLRSAVPGMFCAGFDLNFVGTEQDVPAHEMMYDCFDQLETTDKVCVAYADGHVIGGGVELFLSCDLRLATPESKFRIPPAALGAVYEYRGLCRFVRKLGVTNATEMFLTARTYDAAEALRLGLVTRIVPSWQAANEFCEQASAVSMPAQRAMKAIIHQIAGETTRDQVSEQSWRRIHRLRELAEKSGHLQKNAASQISSSKQ